MKRILTPAERKELKFIERLQSINIYPMLVRKLTEGESSRSVARWAMEQGVEGSPGAWSFSYWEYHMRALLRQVNESKDKMRCEQHRVQRLLPPKPADPDAVLAKVNKTVEDKSMLDYIQNDALNVMKHVMGAEKSIKAAHILQYEAVKQIARIERIDQLEKNMGLPLPNTHNELRQLTAIAGQMARLELGYEMIRGRRGYVPLVPAGTGEMSPFARKMMEFDPVDRSIARELVVNFIDMVEGGTVGRFEAAGLEADETGEDSTVVGDEPGTVQPPFTQGPPDSQD